MIAWYIVRRVGQAVFVLWAAYSVTFLLLFVLPQDAVDSLFDPTRMSAELEAEKDRIRVYYGLDQPVWVQYVTQLANVLRGDLGISIQTGRPVGTSILELLPSTLILSTAALGLAILLAFALAVVAVSTRWQWLSNLLRSFPPLFVSVPVFVIALVLLQIFSFQLHWFPSIGDRGLPSLVLPAVALAIPIAGPLAHLLIKNASLELRKPYVVTAIAKGYRPVQVVWRDVLKNAALPALTLAGLTFGNLLAGAIIVETAFSRSGIGRLSETAVRNQDIPVVQGIVLFAALVFVVVNLIVDLIYPLLDPKLGADIAAGKSVTPKRALVGSVTT